MKLSYKNWGLRYARLVGRTPSAWIVFAALIVLPNPTLPTPRRLGMPRVVRDLRADFVGPPTYPVIHTSAPREVSAKGVYVVDADSMVPILVKNSDQPLRPASTTKIMTALVAMDTLEESRVLGSSDARNAIGKTIHLSPAAQFGFEDLLYALLLESGNDVALTLGENYPGGYQTMIRAMNDKAQVMGLAKTVYKNVSGIDEIDHVTTVHDLAVLAVEAMKNPEFKKIVGTREKLITSVDGKSSIRLQTTNELLGKTPGVIGIKTGNTPEAGECLVTAIERDGHTIVIVVLGSKDRFGDTKKLIDWAFANVQWEVVVDSSHLGSTAGT